MSHARESLATLLAKPGKCLNARPADKTSYFQVVSQLLPDIETYRTRGYSLGEIYGALVRGGDIGCTIGTFRAYYYRARRDAEQMGQMPEVLVSDTGVSQAEDVQERASTSEPVTMQPPLTESVVESEPTAGAESPSLLTITDAQLQAQQALARRMFAQRRAELGMRRRGE